MKHKEKNDLQFCLVGNKKHLCDGFEGNDARQVTSEEARELAEANDCQYFEASTVTNEGV